MKPVQILAILATLIVGLIVISSMINPQTVTNVLPTVTKEPSPEDAKLVGEPGHEYYTSNPFDLSSKEANQPVVDLPESLHNFGTMSLGTTREHDFVIKNTGSVPLKLARGPSQCKCTLSGLAEEVVEPGAETKINLSWKPTDSGPFFQEAIIWTNDPKQPRLQMKVQGEMFPALVVTPVPGWNLGSVIHSNPVELLGTIESSVFESIGIKNITTSSDLVSLETTPFTPEELALSNVTSGHKLKMIFKGTDVPGPINEKITVETDLPENQIVTFDVIGTRTGPMSVIGPNWYTSGPLMDLGTIDQAKGKEIKLTIMIEPGESELQFSDIQSSPAFVSLRLKPEQVGQELVRERYTLFVTVPPDSPKGVWNTANPGRIKLKINHPKITELDIKLHMAIE